MKGYLVFVIVVGGIIFSLSCGGGEPTSNTAKNANSNSANAATAPAPAKGDFYSAVYAMKGNRMPDDAKLAEQKRDFRNALHLNIKKPEGGIKSLNWEEKFKDPTNLKLEEGEHVLVITFASAEGKKLEKGVYEATEDADAVNKAAKDKPFAIITLIDSTGAKRLKGKVNVSSADDIIMYSFDEKPNAPGLDSMSYGAPFKN
jgi:hypothetical protein